MLSLRPLTAEELTVLYETELTRDFAPAERKPLSMIRAACSRGEYAAYGICEGEQRIGYALLVVLEGVQLLDYFAVSPELRGRGRGTEALHLLASSCRTDCLLLETEDPDRMPGEMPQRRLQFCLRAGCRDTGVRAEIWDVPYRVLLLAGDGAQALSRYAQIYRHNLPPALFAQRVRIRLQAEQNAETKKGEPSNG